MLPYCHHFQLHIQIWLLNRIGNCLIHSSLVNHIDCRFEFRDWSLRFSFKPSHRILLIVFIIEPIMVYFEWHMDTAKTSVVVVVVVVSFLASRSHGHHCPFLCVVRCVHDVLFGSSLSLIPTARRTTSNLWYVTLLWSLSTPHTHLVVGSYQELSHPVNEYKSHRLKVKFQNRSTKFSLNSFHIDSPNHVSY